MHARLRGGDGDVQYGESRGSGPHRGSKLTCNETSGPRCSFTWDELPSVGTPNAVVTKEPRRAQVFD